MKSATERRRNVVGTSVESLLRSSAPGGGAPTNQQTNRGTERSYERSRLRRESKVTRSGGTTSRGRTNAGKVWGEHSVAYPGELKSAARRIRTLVGKGLDHEELCAALAVYARILGLDGQPHHAHGFTEYVARTFIAKLRQDRRAAEREAEKITVQPQSRGLHRPDFSAFMREAT